MARSVATTVAWLGLLWLLAAALTVAGFYSFIIGEDRGATFYWVLSYICFAELILFGYTAYLWTVPHTVQRPSRAVRLRVMVLVVIWFLAILVTGILAVRPSAADTWYSDKILLFHLLLTFLLLLGAYVLHRADVTLQLERDAPERQRVSLNSLSSMVQTSIESVRSLSGRYTEHTEPLDHLAKRLDILKSQLLAASPAAHREQTRTIPVPALEGIEQRLQAIQGSVKALETAKDEALAERVGEIREAADSLIASLREREDKLSY